MHRHSLRRQRRSLPFSGQLVSADALNFFRRELRRHLLELAAESGQMRLEIDSLDIDFSLFPCRRASRVVRIGGPAELNRSLVRLLHSHQIRLQPRRLPHAEHQQASGQRIKSAGMSDLLDPGTTAEHFHHVVRRDAALLVD